MTAIPVDAIDFVTRAVRKEMNRRTDDLIDRLTNALTSPKESTDEAS